MSTTDVTKNAEEFDKLSQSMELNVQPVPLETIGKYKGLYKKKFPAIEHRLEGDRHIPMQDRDLFTYSPEQISDIRAKNQPVADQWGNAALKMTTTAVTTFLDGTVGNLIGIPNAMTEDKMMSGFIFNPFSKAMNDFQKKMEEDFPNYYTREAAETHFDLTKANFWADKLLKNLGFTIGAVAAGAVTGGALSAMAGTSELTKQLVSKGLKGAVKGAMTGADVSAVRSALQSGAILSDDLVVEMAKIGTQIQRQNLAIEAVSSVVASVGEARIEAINGQEEIYRDYIEQGMSPEEAYNKSMAAANLIFGGNVAVLSLGNFAQFRNAFSGGFHGAKDVAKAVAGDMKQGYRAFTKGEVLKGAAKVLKNPIIEGNEEVAQATVKNFAEDYILKSQDKSGMEKVNQFIESTIKAVKETYGDPAALEEGLVGFLTGFMPIPYFGKGGVNFTGGAIGEMKEQLDLRGKSKEQAEILEKIRKSDAFMQRYSSAIRSQNYEDQKQQHLANNDIHSFKNAEYAQFVNDLNSFIDAGRFEDFIANLDSVSATEASDLRRMFQTIKEVEVKTPDGKVEKKQEIIDPYKNTPIDSELKDYLVEKANRLSAEARYVKDLRTSIERRFPQISDVAKQMMLINGAMIHNSETRMNSLDDTLHKLGYTGVSIKSENNTHPDSDTWNEFKENAEEFLKRLTFTKSPLLEEAKETVNAISNLKLQRDLFADTYLSMFGNPEQTEQTASETVSKSIKRSLEDKLKATKVNTYLRDSEGNILKIRKYKDKLFVYGLGKNGNFTKRIGEYNLQTMSNYVEDTVITGENFGDPIKQMYEEAIEESANVEELFDLMFGDLEGNVTLKNGETVKALRKAELKGFDYYRKKAMQRYQELTGKKPSKNFGQERYQEHIYMNDKGDKKMLIFDYNGKKIYVHSYGNYLKKMSGKLTNQQFIKDQERSFDNAKDFNEWKEKTGFKPKATFWEEMDQKATMTNLEQMISVREAALRKMLSLIAEKDKVLDDILEAYKKKVDRLPQVFGAARNSIQKSIDTLYNQIMEVEKSTRPLMDERNKLQQEIDYLIDRMAQVEAGEEADFKSQIDEYKKEIAKSDELIEDFKSYLRAIVELIKRISSALSRMLRHKESGTSVEQLRKEMYNEAVLLKDEITLLSLIEQDNAQLRKKNLKYAMDRFRAAVTKLLNGEVDVQSEIENEQRVIKALQEAIATEEAAKKKWQDKIDLITEELLGLEKVKEIERNKIEPVPVVQKIITKKSRAVEPGDTVYSEEDVIPETGSDKDLLDNGINAVKRYLNQVFKVFAGNSKNNPDPSQKRYFQFVNKHNVNGLKGTIVPSKLLISEQEFERLNELYPNTAFYSVILTDKDGNFIGKDGKPLEDENGNTFKTINNQVVTEGIYTSLPTSNLKVKDDDKFFTPTTATQWKLLYPDLTIEEAKAKFEEDKKRVVAEHQQFLSNVAASIEKGTYPVVQILGKTKGIEVVDMVVKPDPTSMKHTLQVENADSLSIILYNKKESKTVQNTTGVFYVPGIVYVKDKNGNTYKADRTYISEADARVAYQLLKYFAQNLKLVSGSFAISKNAGLISLKSGTSEVKTSVFDLLSNFTFWTGDNLTANGKKELARRVEQLKESGLDEDIAYNEIYSKSVNLVNTNPRTAFYWKPKSNKAGGELVIGEQSIALLGEDGNVNPVLEQHLVAFLTSQRTQVRKTLLRSTTNKSSTYLHPVEVNAETKSVSTKAYNSYEDYLIEQVLISQTLTNGTTNEQGEERLTHENQNLYYSYKLQGSEQQAPAKNQTPAQPSVKTTKAVKDNFIYGKDFPESVPLTIQWQSNKYEATLMKKGANFVIEGIPDGLKAIVNPLLDPNNEDGISTLAELEDITGLSISAENQPVKDSKPAVKQVEVAGPANAEKLDHGMSIHEMKDGIYEIHGNNGSVLHVSLHNKTFTVIDSMYTEDKKRNAALAVTTAINNTFSSKAASTINGLNLLVGTQGISFEFYRINDVNKDEEFMRSKSENYEGQEDIKKMEAWFKKRFPGVDFHVVQQIVGSNSWGKFYDAAVYITKNAEVGTTYHESWHVVTQLFMNKDERFMLYEEARERMKGKTVRVGVNGVFSEIQGELMTDRQAEEFLAEEFRDYMMGKDISLFKGKTTKSLFKKLKDFLMNFINKLSFGYFDYNSRQTYDQSVQESNIYKVFKAIDSNTLPRRLFTNSGETFFRPIKGTTGIYATEAFKRDAMEVLDSYFFNWLLDQKGFSIFDVYREGVLDKQEIYDSMKEVLRKKAKYDFDPKVREAVQQLIDNWDVPGGVVASHIQHLTRYGIVELTQEEILEGVDETSRSKDVGKIVPVAALKLNHKKSATNVVKLLLSTLPKIVYDNGNVTYLKSGYLNMNSSSDFGYLYTLLSDKLVNLESFEEMEQMLDTLISVEPTLLTLKSRLKIGVPAEFIDADTMLLRLQFEQTFRKDKTNYVYAIQGLNSSFKINDATEEGVNKRIRQEFQAKTEKMADQLFTTRNGIRYYKPGPMRPYETRPGDVEGFFDMAQKWYAQYGIDIDFKSPLIDFDLKLDIAGLPGILQQWIDQGVLSNLWDNNEDHDQRGTVRKLIKAKRQESIKNIETSHFNMNGDRVYDNTLLSFVTMVTEMINKGYTVEELSEYFPFLANSPAARLYIKGLSNNPRPIRLMVLEGILNESSRESVEFGKLEEADKLVFSFNAYREGYYKLLRPADNSVERLIEMDVHPGIQAREFIESEIQNAIAIKASDKKFKNITEKEPTGIFLELLKSQTQAEKEGKPDESYMFRELIQDVVNEDMSFEEFWKEYGADCEERLRTHLNDEANRLFDTYQRAGIIKEGSKGYYKFGSLKMQSDTLTKENLIGEFYNYAERLLYVNAMQMQLFFGDPNSYKNTDAMFKRFAGSVGTKKLSSVSSSTDTFIDNFMKDLRGRTSLKSGTNPVIRTFVFQDIESINTDFLENLHENLGLNDPELSESRRQSQLKSVKAYGSITKEINGKPFYYTYQQYKNMSADERKAVKVEGVVEGDGASYVSLDAWREMKFRVGDWSFGENSLEALYQWERYEYNDIPENKRFYVDPVTGKQSEKPININRLPVANALKPQYYGPSTDGIHTMYKTSLLPLLPSMVKNRPLEKLHDFMIENQISIASHYSANKGISTRLTDQGRMNSIYNTAGEFQVNDDFVTQDIFYRFYGIQLDTGNRVKQKVVTGTQMMKQMLSNLFSGGKPKNERFKQYVDDYLKLNERRLKLGRQMLMDYFQLEQDKNGNYIIKDNEQFIKRLQQEAIERDSPDNVMDAIKLVQDTLNIDMLPNRVSVEYLLASMADSMLISQKRKGGAYYQEPSTLFEAAVTRENQEFDGKVYKATDLGFITKKIVVNERTGETKTVVTSMEVYLPDIYNGKVDVNNKTELLNLIGFRIPTQGLNSIESITVKGFLPKSAGELIIMPSDIVAKAGSDYDIDKLNLYFPYYYEDATGELFYINPNKSINEQYNHYASSFVTATSNKLFNKLVGISNIGQNIRVGLKAESGKVFLKDMIHQIVKTHPESWEQFIDQMDHMQQIESAERRLLIQSAKNELIEMINNGEVTVDDIATFPMTINEFALQHTQNAITELQRRILTDPDNYAQWITPNSSHILKEESEYINSLLGVNRDNENMSKLVSPTYLNEVEKRFLGAADAIGITALASTFHVMSQISGLQLGSGISKQGVNVSTYIRLSHHRVNGAIQLGMEMDVKGEHNIANILSQWINATVDAATDPFMFDLNATTETLPTVLMLVATGVPIREIALFMNQPLIKKYLQLKSNAKSIDADLKNADDSKYDIVKSLIGYNANDIKFLNKSFDDHQPTEYYMEQQLKASLKGKENEDFQKQMLVDYFRYELMAQEISSAIQATTYDTHGVGRTYTDALMQLKSTANVMTNGFILGFDKLFSEGFFGPYKTSVDLAANMMQSLFTTTSREDTMQLVEKFADYFSKQPLTKENKSKVINKFRLDFVNYLATVLPLNFDGLIAKPISETISEQLNKEEEKAGLLRKLGSHILKLQQDIDKGIDVPGKALIKSLVVVYNDDITNIRPSTKALSNLEHNEIVEAWRILYNHHKGLAVALVRINFVQGGLKSSGNNFLEWVPAEIYFGVMKDLLQRFDEMSAEERTLLLNNYQIEFFPDNYEDNNIVPKESKFTRLPFTKKWLFVEKMTNSEVSKRLAKGAQVFKSKPALYLFNQFVDLIPTRSHKTNHLITGYGRMADYLKSFMKKNHILLSPESVIQFQPKHIDLIEAGNKTKTSRTQYIAPGIYRVDDKTTVQVLSTTYYPNINKQSESEPYIEDKDKYAREEGYKNIDDMYKNTSYKHIRDFIDGKRGMYVSDIEIVKPVTSDAVTENSSKGGVIIFEGYWTREQVAKQTDKVFLFGDNTHDRTVTNHIPTSTQAVIRGLPNAIGIDTKKDRNTNAGSYFSDSDFQQFKAQVDQAIQEAKDSGKTIVIPKDGIGTGNAQLSTRAPKLYAYLRDKLRELITEDANAKCK